MYFIYKNIHLLYCSKINYYFQITGTFGASMVFGPALGSYIMEIYNATFVVLLASLIALLNVIFIIVVVPESLPYKQRSFINSISWKKADPFTVNAENFFFTSILILFSLGFENGRSRSNYTDIVLNSIFIISSRSRRIFFFICVFETCMYYKLIQIII